MVAQHQMTSGFKGGGQRSDDRRGRREPKASTACHETHVHSTAEGRKKVKNEGKCTEYEYV